MSPNFSCFSYLASQPTSLVGMGPDVAPNVFTNHWIINGTPLKRNNQILNLFTKKSKFVNLQK